MLNVLLSRSFYSRCHQRGIAMLELALVIPILLLIFFGGFEFTRYLRTSQAMSNIAREYGNSIFRSCGRCGDDCAACISNPLTQQPLNQMRELLLPGSQVITTVYGCSIDTVNMTVCDVTSGPPPASFITSLSSDPMNYPAPDGTAMNASHYLGQSQLDAFRILNESKMRIITTEVFYQYKPISPLVSKFFSNYLNLYETVLY